MKILLPALLLIAGLANAEITFTYLMLVIYTVRSQEHGLVEPFFYCARVPRY